MRAYLCASSREVYPVLSYFASHTIDYFDKFGVPDLYRATAHLHVFYMVVFASIGFVLRSSSIYFARLALERHLEHYLIYNLSNDDNDIVIDP